MSEDTGILPFILNGKRERSFVAHSHSGQRVHKTLFQRLHIGGHHLIRADFTRGIIGVETLQPFVKPADKIPVARNRGKDFPAPLKRENTEKHVRLVSQIVKKNSKKTARIFCGPGVKTSLYHGLMGS